MSPLVSVVMPNYNGSRFLEDTIESVLRQSFQDYEFIIVDDASTDHSMEIIGKYQKDPRIRVHRQEKNGQICTALNKGLSLAKGKYIARIDSDDLWLPDKLERQVCYMESHEECGVCFTQLDIIDEDGNIINDHESALYSLFSQENRTREAWIRKLYLEGNCLPHPSAVIRRDALFAVGEYDYIGLQLQDYDLWLRILLIHSIYIIEEPLLRYRRVQKNNQSISAPTLKGQVREFNERVLLLDGYLDKMEQNLFIRCFQKEFVNADSETEMEIKCEKAFLQLKVFERAYGSRECYLLALKPLKELLNQEEGRYILEEKFHFTCKDYYEITGKHIFSDYILEKSGVSALKKKLVLYYDTGNGYNEREKSEQDYICANGRVEIKMLLSMDRLVKCKKIRVDLLDDEAGVFCHVRFRSGGEKVAFVPVNGFLQDEYLIFPTMDPQIEIEADQIVDGELQIQASMIVGGRKEVEDWLTLLERERESGRKQLQYMETVVERQKDKLEKAEQEKRKQLHYVETVVERQKDKLKKAEQEKWELEEKLRNVRNELFALAEAYAEERERKR